MHQDKYVFAQVVEFLNEDKFRRIVAKYDGNRYIKSYSVWNQLLTLIFGQLSRSPSLRDCVIALQAHRDKLYHLLNKTNFQNDKERSNSGVLLLFNF